MGLLALAILFLTFVLAFEVIEVKAFVIVYYNVIISLSMILIKSMSIYIWPESELLYIR